MVDNEASEEELGVEGGKKDEEIGVGVDVGTSVDGGDKGTIDLRRGKE